MLNNKIDHSIRFASIIFLFFIKQNCIAQRVYNYNLPGMECYSEIIFEEKAKEPKGVIVINVNEDDIKEYSKNNRYLNSGLFINYNFMYVKILDKSTDTPLSCFNTLIEITSYVNKIYKNSFYLIQNKTEVAQKIAETKFQFSIVTCNEYNLNEMLEVLDKASVDQVYKKPAIFEDMDEEYYYKITNYKRNFDFGLYYSRLFLTGPKLNFDASSLGIYNLSFRKNLGYKTSITLDLSFSYKIPNQKKLQSELQAEMQQSMQGGSSTVHINKTINGHIYFGTNLGFRYYFEKENAFRKYFSLGIGFQSLTTIKAVIDKTVNISDIQNGGGGGLSDGLDNTPTKNDYTTPFFEAGFDYRLSPVTKLNFGLPIKYYINQNDRSLNTLSLGLNLGISFTFNPSNIPKPNKKVNK